MSDLAEQPAMIKLRSSGALVLVGTTVIGAGLGAALAPNKRILGAVLGTVGGIALPVALSLLVLAPLARLKVGAAAG